MAYMTTRRREYEADLLRNFDAMTRRAFGSAGVDLAPFPAVDVRDEHERYVIEAELPGFTPDDVDIELKDDVLSISSADRSRDTEDVSVPTRRERAFVRRFSVPKDVNRDSIEAAFTNGLLVVTLTKQPEAQPRKIEVSAA